VLYQISTALQAWHQLWCALAELGQKLPARGCSWSCCACKPYRFSMRVDLFTDTTQTSAYGWLQQCVRIGLCNLLQQIARAYMVLTVSVSVCCCVRNCTQLCPGSLCLYSLLCKPDSAPFFFGCAGSLSSKHMTLAACPLPLQLSTCQHACTHRGARLVLCVQAMLMCSRVSCILYWQSRLTID
jgi:hypothetical protein